MGEEVLLSNKEYLRLMADSTFLSYLEGEGVDNWDGYDDARKLYNEEYGEDYGEF